jgi:glucosamine--fructose-6-phosphate aminotransferase (isomerizing)
MCGIVGYVGHRQAAEILLEGLKRLEYRGYDSAGLAIGGDDGIVVLKSAGKLAVLESLVGEMPPTGSLGIGHTRWATHGAPTTRNAHPHTDDDGTVAVIHNGIIENATRLREALTERGHVFRSETDTEVIAHLIDELFEDSLEQAVVAAVKQLEGTYGLAIVSTRDPGKLVGARHGSPLLIGVGQGEQFLASDAAAVVKHTRSVVYMDDDEVAVLTPDSYELLDLHSASVQRGVHTVDWSIDTIERGGHAHFMLKEILEQPEAIRNTMRGRLLEDEGTARLGGIGLSDQELLDIDQIVLTACGTSWHAALIGEYMLEEFARVRTEVEYASEFRYRTPLVDSKTLVIAISQSGETADTLAAIREAKRRGARTLGLVNAVGSSIAREVDSGTYLHAGPEIGVASTKAFSCQVVALALLTLRLARLRSMSVLQGREFVSALCRLPGQVEQILANTEPIEALADRYALAQNALFLGRGYNFPVALEGALKLKEISYIHAEGYPAAEMKHGPIALIDEKMPVVCVAPRDAVYQKVLSNVQEVKTRSGRVIAVVSEGDRELTRIADHTITIPPTLDSLTPILSVVPLQLFAYHVAVRRGCDVDQPRNLAKSVTVE